MINDGWYIGKTYGYPTTNNGIEATNKWIKDQGTFRKKLQINQFLYLMNNLISGWSEERNPSCINFKKFSIVPTPSLKMFTEAYHWIKANPKIIMTNQYNRVKTYYVSSSNDNTIDSTIIKKYELNYQKHSWETFEEYWESRCGIWKI